MRLLLLTDIHSSMENLEGILKVAEYDAVLIAGDLTQFRPKDAPVVDQIVAKFTDTCLAVHGNCDHEVILDKNYDVIEFIHGKTVRLDDFTIHGLGGSGITPFNTPSEYTYEEILNFMKQFEPGEKNILLTHCPPKGVLDRTYSGIHAGCEAIRERMNEFDMIVSGHIHECHGVDRTLTLAVNPGPVMWGRFAIFDSNSQEIRLLKL